MIVSLHLFGIVFVFPDPIINVLANDSPKWKDIDIPRIPQRLIPILLSKTIILRRRIL